MKYKLQQKVNDFVFSETDILTENKVFKDLAHRMVEELPVEAVKKLFNLKRLQGTPSAIDQAILNRDVLLERELKDLRERKESLFTGQINLED